MHSVSGRQIRWPLCALIVTALLLQMASAANIPAPNQAYFPSTSSDQKKKSNIVIDYGNANDGYIMVKYTKSGNKKIMCLVSKGDAEYQYVIPRDDTFQVLPMQMGNGTYKVNVYEQAKGDSYTPRVNLKITDVSLTSKYIPYLYPNQRANYDETSKAVAKSRELCEGLETEQEKFDAIWDFCTTKISYHHIRAFEVSSGKLKGYLPDVDETLREGLGICYDYAALMACMLRVQSIPTQLVIGWADDNYHAWNNILLDGEWIRRDATFVASGGSAANYTEEMRF